MEKITVPTAFTSWIGGMRGGVPECQNSFGQVALKNILTCVAIDPTDPKTIVLGVYKYKFNFNDMNTTNQPFIFSMLIYALSMHILELNKEPPPQPNSEAAIQAKVQSKLDAAITEFNRTVPEASVRRTTEYTPL